MRIISLLILTLASLSAYSTETTSGKACEERSIRLVSLLGQQIGMGSGSTDLALKQVTQVTQQCPTTAVRQNAVDTLNVGISYRDTNPTNKIADAIVKICDNDSECAPHAIQVLSEGMSRDREQPTLYIAESILKIAASNNTPVVRTAALKAFEGALNTTSKSPTLDVVADMVKVCDKDPSCNAHVIKSLEFAITDRKHPTIDVIATIVSIVKSQPTHQNIQTALNSLNSCIVNTDSSAYKTCQEAYTLISQLDAEDEALYQIRLDNIPQGLRNISLFAYSNQSKILEAAAQIVETHENKHSSTLLGADEDLITKVMVINILAPIVENSTAPVFTEKISPIYKELKKSLNAQVQFSTLRAVEHNVISNSVAVALFQSGLNATKTIVSDVREIAAINDLLIASARATADLNYLQNLSNLIRQNQNLIDQISMNPNTQNIGIMLGICADYISTK